MNVRQKTILMGIFFNNYAKNMELLKKLNKINLFELNSLEKNIKKQRIIDIL